ncbi:hypothetical protein CHUAL_011446 [Chamberlinius hualienensis]
MESSIVAGTSTALPEDIIDINTLKRWSDVQVPQETNGYRRPSLPGRVHDRPPFPFNPQLNEKVALWVGYIGCLNAHAIVNSTNEALNDRNPLSERISKDAGPQLKNEIQQTVKVCKTGEAKATKGYNLPARYVIHTVGPRYNVRYQTAAEGALHSCYRKTMQLVRELGLQTVALCVINSVRRGFPPLEGCHIALRTVRRFLEKHGDAIESVAFVLEEGDVGIYESLMPLYFPRNHYEEEASMCLLPEDLGSDEGEPFVADRQIRITDKPHTNSTEIDVGESTGLLYSVENPLHVGNTDFAKMMGDVDKVRPLKRNPPVERDLAVEVQEASRYERILRKAQTTDLSEIEQIGCLFPCGVDRFGRPVIVLVGKWFNYYKINLEKAMLYLVYLLYKVAKKDYIIIYFNTLTAGENRPSLAWIKEVYSVLEYKYRKNLKALYIVHPTIWTKILTWGFTTFMAPNIKEKVHNLSGLEYLYGVMNMEQLEIPTFIREYDMTINGVHYYEATSDADEL